jgi:hypothetical protein
MFGKSHGTKRSGLQQTHCGLLDDEHVNGRCFEGIARYPHGSYRTSKLNIFKHLPCHKPTPPRRTWLNFLLNNILLLFYFRFWSILNQTELVRNCKVSRHPKYHFHSKTFWINQLSERKRNRHHPTPPDTTRHDVLGHTRARRFLRSWDRPSSFDLWAVSGLTIYEMLDSKTQNSCRKAVYLYLQLAVDSLASPSEPFFVNRPIQ